MSPLTAPRCYFCNDDRHVNLLVREGSIDHCIRVAVNAGVPFELAIRMATLSIAECFGLTDLGLIAPGRRADFCVLAKTGGFVISEVYKNGVLSSDIPKKISPPPCPVPEFNCAYPVSADLVLLKTGVSQVIGIIYGDIVTENTSLLVGGLMTTESAEETLRRLDEVAAHLKRTGTFSQAFGHLSYLSLTIIPHLKITPKGLFDVDAFENMELLQ